jgi:protein-tyrosine phosphatase
MAAAVFRARVEEAGLDGRVEVDSAGTGGWHEGDGADRRAIAVLTANGYEGRHVARQFRAGWFAERDLVIALDSGHLRQLRRLAADPEEAARIRLLLSYVADTGDDPDVPDPYYGDTDGFEHCLALIEPAAQALLDTVRAALDDSEEAACGR